MARPEKLTYANVSKRKTISPVVTVCQPHPLFCNVIDPQQMIAFDLLTGFLGSGKTTLLNAFLQREAGADTAVVVNEFGAIGLDQLVYREVSDQVYLLDSGCLCCTVTHSLRETLLEIKSLTARLGRPPLRRVVVETTGLADPLPVLHALLGDKALMQHYCLGQVIATVDAVQGSEQLDRHIESQRQVAVAEHLVITKTDLAEPEQLLALRRKLQSLNARAQVSESCRGQSTGDLFTQDPGDRRLQLLPPTGGYVALSQPGSPSVVKHASGVGSWSTFTDLQPTWAGISAWWNLLVHHFGPQLLRCKGLLRVQEREDKHAVVLIQGVGKVFHSPTLMSAWPDQDPRGRLVCIGLDLEPDWLQASLQALRITEPSSRPRNLAELTQCF